MGAINDFISFYTHLPIISKVFLLLGFGSLLVTHFIYLRSKRGLIPLLLLTALLIASAFAAIDPFLHTWDESFHALVAKNASEGYLSPHLINEDFFRYNPEVWIGNYIWLHKPPLSLWQMAASIDLFGKHILAVRLPSILAFGGTCVFVYKIGERLFDKKMAYYGALLFILYQFGLEQVAGIHTADHIDVAFTFYVTASFWAWISFQQDRKTVFLVLTGLFVGLAVLTKWMVGLLVFGVWGVHLITLMLRHRENLLNELFSMLKSLGIALLVMLPWNIYAAIRYPVEYWFEFNHARRHFYEVIELHGGDGWFYWDNLSNLFGSGTLMPYIVLFSLIGTILILKKSRERIAIATFVLLPYLFFTMASTKMSNFVSIVSPIILLCMAVLFYRLAELLNERTKPSKYWSFILLPLFLIFFLRPKESLRNHHFNDVWVRTFHEYKQTKIKELKTMENAVYFYYDARHYEQIIHMFYHNNLALPGLPTREQLERIKDEGRRLVIVYKDVPPENLDFPKNTRFIKMPDRQTSTRER